MFLVLSIAATASAQKITKESLQSQGTARTYYLFVPDSAKAKPAPLLILLHGSGRDGRILVEHWQSLAKKEGIILAGPDAVVRQGWGRDDGPLFIRDVIEAVQTDYAVDRRAMYVFGHSAGAILHGHFLGALSRLRVPIESCHLWAPACTVEFATETYGAAIAGGMLPAERMFIEVLSDANERGHFTVPGLYSKSLLYLVSRGLEPEHKTPILGLEMTLPTRRESAALQDVFSAEAIAGVWRWNEVAKGVVYAAPIAAPVVPTRLLDGQAETVDADHGSFDNSLDSFNRAIAGMLRVAPPLPAVDLTGY
jgi:acetyl esterase/lipase